MQCLSFYQFKNRFHEDSIVPGDHLVHLMEVGPGVFAAPPHGVACQATSAVVGISGLSVDATVEVRLQSPGDSAGTFTGTVVKARISKLVPDDNFILHVSNGAAPMKFHGAPAALGSPLAVVMHFREK